MCVCVCVCVCDCVCVIVCVCVCVRVCACKCDGQVRVYDAFTLREAPGCCDAHPTHPTHPTHAPPLLSLFLRTPASPQLPLLTTENDLFKAVRSSGTRGRLCADDSAVRIPEAERAVV